MKLHPAPTSHAQKAHIFPGIKRSSLISIGQLCDDGCTAVLNNKEIGIYKNNTIILRGKRNFTDGLWDITIPTPDSLPTQFANVIIRQDKTKFELASYLHGCAFRPVLSTFQTAIRKGHFLTWPGIENINFDKILRATSASVKGHLDQERKNLQLTQIQITEADLHPIDGGLKTYECASIIIPFNPKTKSYVDLTGRFPYKSSSGNEYIYVMYDFDLNAIFGYPIKNRQAKTLTEAWETLHSRLTQHAILPSTLFLIMKSVSN